MFGNDLTFRGPIKDDDSKVMDETEYGCNSEAHTYGGTEL